MRREGRGRRKRLKQAGASLKEESRQIAPVNCLVFLIQRNK